MTMKTNELVIAPIQMCEIDEAINLLEKSVKENNKRFLDRSRFETRTFIEKLIQQETENKGAFLVGKVDHKIVSIGALDPDAMQHINPNIPELGKAHVDSNYQRRGYGMQMAKARVDLALNYGYKGAQFHTTIHNEILNKMFNASIEELAKQYPDHATAPLPSPLLDILLEELPVGKLYTSLGFKCQGIRVYKSLQNNGKVKYFPTAFFLYVNK